jgi:glucose-6-phosphate isomerase
MPHDAGLPERAQLAASWDRLTALAARPGGGDIRALFAADSSRAARYTARLNDLSIDFSKTAIDDEAFSALLAHARAGALNLFRDQLFGGDAVNTTEHRAAMHMALRDGAQAGFWADLPSGREPASQIAAGELARMRDFVGAVHDGTLRGATGEAFTHVFSIGIGGSDLGPAMVTEALTMARGPRLQVRYISNVDATGLAAATRGIDPARTLILIASKTFTTQETAENARAARAWLVASLGETAVAAHFVALSTNRDAVAAFGIVPERMFGFRDWVGGRFSLWSPVGLSIALAAGWENFQSLLHGAAAMDAHFRSAPFASNLPVLLALVGLWHINACGHRAHCVLAYDDRLRRFPAFLQQLEMESNGKSVGLDGHEVVRPTCPVLFGEPGTNAQHSFMQLVHQGTQVIPVDFILAANPDHDRPDAHRILAAHAFAQAEALLRGRARDDVQAEMRERDASLSDIAEIAPHRVFPGNRPSITILQSRLDAFSLGRLIALYEHKVAVQGWLWGINSFDQWGVELGKVLANGILPDLAPDSAPGAHDGSTNALIARFRALRGES